MPTLIAKRITYYSQGDEAAFFNWIASITCIDAIEGMGDELHLHFRQRRVSDKNLRELIGLFHRYGVSMRQLAQFKTPRNERWFAAPQMYWFKRVFGGGRA